MKITKRQIKLLCVVVLLTTFLTCFFYWHEYLPKPLRAATALIETPVAVVSGLCHYLNIGIEVYETPWVVVLANLIFSVVIVLLISRIFRGRKKKV